jgi:alkylhydroperoxidase/carboxymuconolactone decarboxylase family protein YurZ
MEAAQPRHWAEAFFGNPPPDSREARLLALACALMMGHPEIAQHHYKAAREAGALDRDLQNVTAIASQVVGADLTPLAFETVWPAPEEPAGSAPEE